MSFNKEGMLHLCDSTVAGLTARRDNELVSKCEYPSFWEFGEGVDSARGLAAIVVCCRNSSCNSSCDAIARNG